jgi:hypothetical protein
MEMAASDLNAHVESVVGLINDLTSRSLAYSKQGYERELSKELRKLIYTLANHLGKLAKRQGVIVPADAINTVRKRLKELGISDWSPEELVRWCYKCGYDPLYSRRQESCAYCNGMVCPECNNCFQQKGCPERGTQRKKNPFLPASDGDGLPDVPTGPPDIPF